MTRPRTHLTVLLVLLYSHCSFAGRYPKFNFGKFKDLDPPRLDGTTKWALWESQLPSVQSYPINFQGKQDSTLPIAKVDCNEAPESCQNLCWYSYCRRNTMVFACGGGGNRGNSGCQYSPCSDNMKAKANCKYHKTCWYAYHGGLGHPTITEVMNDDEDTKEKQYDGNPECDEFPPNAFNMVSTARRSLRCIGDKDNKSSGQDYKAACKGVKRLKIKAIRENAEQGLTYETYNIQRYTMMYRGGQMSRQDYNNWQASKENAEKWNRIKKASDDTIWDSVDWNGRRFNLMEKYEGRRRREGYCKVGEGASYRSCLWELPEGNIRDPEKVEDPWEKNVAQFYWISRGSADGGSQKKNYFVEPPFWASLSVQNPGQVPGMGLPVYNPASVRTYYPSGLFPAEGSSSGGRHGHRKMVRDVGNTTEPRPESGEGQSVGAEDNLVHPLARRGPEDDGQKLTMRKLLLSNGRILEDEHMRAGRGDGLISRINGTSVFLEVVKEL